MIDAFHSANFYEFAYIIAVLINLMMLHLTFNIERNLIPYTIL